MKIIPADLVNIDGSTVDEIFVEAHVDRNLSEIAKPIIDGYQSGFAPVVNKPFLVFVACLMVFTATLFYLTA